MCTRPGGCPPWRQPRPGDLQRCLPGLVHAGRRVSSLTCEGLLVPPEEKPLFSVLRGVPGPPASPVRPTSLLAGNVRKATAAFASIHVPVLDETHNLAPGTSARRPRGPGSAPVLPEAGPNPHSKALRAMPPDKTVTSQGSGHPALEGLRHWLFSFSLRLLPPRIPHCPPGESSSLVSACVLLWDSPRTGRVPSAPPAWGAMTLLHTPATQQWWGCRHLPTGPQMSFFPGLLAPQGQSQPVLPTPNASSGWPCTRTINGPV